MPCQLLLGLLGGCFEGLLGGIRERSQGAMSAVAVN